MSLLEDRLLRILELRKLGRDEQEIASVLELSAEIVKDYESSVYEEIRKYPHNSPAMLGSNLGVSSLVVQLYRDYLSKKVKESISDVAASSKLEQRAEETQPTTFEWTPEKIKEFRISKGWTQSEFAVELGYKPSYASNICSFEKKRFLRQVDF